MYELPTHPFEVEALELFTYVYSERCYHLIIYLKVFKYSYLHLPKTLHVKVTSLTTSYKKRVGMCE
jgi:hypothetical protein